MAAFLTRAGFADGALLIRTGKQREVEQFLVANAHRLPIPARLEETEAVVRALLGPSCDIVYRRVSLGPGPVAGLVVSVEGLADVDIGQRALEAMSHPMAPGEAPTEPNQLIEWLVENRSGTLSATPARNMERVVQEVLNGGLALFLEGATSAYSLGTSDIPVRSISEPATEAVVRGPREGFTESLHTNLTLVRRRIRDPRLTLRAYYVGSRSRTKVVLAYIRDLCKPHLIQEVERRIQRIKNDALLGSGQLEEFIEDTPWTVFPQVESTERPDVITAALLEGRFAILVDNTPFALTAPTSLNDMMQAPDDYYDRFPAVTFIRALRWTMSFVALMAPSFYVAFTTFHQEMIPTQLLLSVMSAREGVPFPALFEAIMMEVAFEALREAGLRLPRPVGQAVSIVGALIIGQAAVQAGVVSPIMVIVVSLTGIASFVVPKFTTASGLRLLRFVMLILAGTLGAYGMALGSMVLVIHLLSLRSFGAPYMLPFGPIVPNDLDDAVLRSPFWANRTRPSSAESLDPVRAAPNQQPTPARGEEEHS